jgi:HTH-type transcriptional regulator/antitoxin HigA
MGIKPIRNESDHEAALREIERLWGAPQDTPKGDRLDVLVALVEAYERAHYPVDPPDPIHAIRFRLEQAELPVSALVGVIGSRTRVYEVLRGDRPLTLEMIRRVHAKLGIPAEVLIRPATRKRRRAA